MALCTIFNAGHGYKNFPVSPTKDNKFTFSNLELKSNMDFYRIMVDKFVLNVPLSKLTKPLESYRRKDDLSEYYSDTVEYFMLNIDDVKTKQHQNKIVEFFRGYKVILGESKQFNGIDDFSMCGVIFVNPIKLSELKYAIYALNDSLKEYCIINPSAARQATHNAPIGRERVIYDNDGALYTFDRDAVHGQVNIIKESYEYSQLFATSNDHDDILRRTLNRQFVEKIISETEECETIEELSLSVFRSMGFIYINNNDAGALVFKHHTEKNSPGGFFWFKEAPFTMNHLNVLKTTNNYSVIKQIDHAKDLMDVKLDYADLLSSPDNLKETKSITKNQKYLEIDDEVSGIVEEFLYEKDCNLLKIKSAMGTGKSTIIDHIIKESHYNGMSVLIVTNRISVADDFNKKYNVKIYNKDQYHINDSLICQYDSLWRYDMRYFDVVIMDEFVSVLLHSRSSINNSNMNTNKFFKSFNSKVVIADAFLTGYEDYFFENKRKSLMIDNVYRDDTQLFSYTDTNNFVHKILETARTEKVTVSATSTTFIKTLEALLYNNDIKVATLTSETTEFSKEVIYRSFELEENNQFDVLIYSPTLTVGVSNLNNVDKHFHYDTSRSADVISSLQMIKRTRKATEIHFNIKDCRKYNPITYATLRDDYINKIGNNVEQNNLFEYDNYGNPTISKIGKLSILIDVYKNIVEHSHKSAFEHLLSYHFKDEPILVEAKNKNNLLTKYKSKIKLNSIEADEMALNQYLNLNKLDKLNLNISNVSKSLKNIIQIHEMVETDDDAILEEIINLQLTDIAFIDKCYICKLVKMYSKDNGTSNFLQRLISNAIDSSNVVKYNQFNSVLEFTNGLKEQYTEFELKKKPKLAQFLKSLGYRKEKVGIAKYRLILDPNVAKYCDYVII